MAMTTRTTINALAGAKKVLADIRALLPSDARWDLDYWEGHRMHHLNIFADGVDNLELNRAAAGTLSALGKKGIYMVVIVNNALELRNPLHTAKTFPVHESSATK